MGIFDWMKGVTFIEVIEWTDESSDTLVYRFPTYDKMIKMGAQLTVRPSQVAVFVSEGRLADIFQPGRYTLSTKNIPIIVGLMGIPFGGSTPFKSEVYFINMKEFTNFKWGTPNPIMMRTADYGDIRIRGFGTYTFRVADPTKLLKGIVGTSGHFTTDGIMDQLRSFVIQKFADYLGEKRIPVMDLASQYNEISKELADKIQPEFNEYGLHLGRLVIENITLPEALEKEMDERAKLNMYRGVDPHAMEAFKQKQAAEAMRDAAKNPSGMAAAGVGMGAGIVMGQQMAGQMHPQQPPPPPVSPSAPTAMICASCGQMSTQGKFCQHCGKALIRSNQCKACQVEIPPNSKFCPECGAKVL